MDYGEGFELRREVIPDVEEREIERWQFEIGSLVDHRDQPMLSEVLYRARTSKGRQVYGVRRQEECVVRDLMILGEVLVAA